MNPFELATIDIFSDPNFTDTAIIGGREVTVIRSAITDSPVLSEFGIDEGESFTLQVMKKELLVCAPRQNDLVTYGGERFRIQSVELDSSGLVYRITLKSRSSR